MNLLLTFRPIDTSKFADSPFKTDTETQDAYLSLLGGGGGGGGGTEAKKIRKVGS